MSAHSWNARGLIEKMAEPDGGRRQQDCQSVSRNEKAAARYRSGSFLPLQERK
jgi:hypothetical protein